MAIDFSGYTAANIQAQQLAAIDPSIDTREGSLIQTALGPESQALATAYANMQTLQQERSVLTATGSDLDLLAAEVGLTRNTATAPVMILTTDQPCTVGTVTASVPAG